LCWVLSRWGLAFCLGWPPAAILLISASRVARTQAPTALRFSFLANCSRSPECRRHFSATVHPGRPTTLLILVIVTRV
jgi:integral membrane sensor domain MASE1